MIWVSCKWFEEHFCFWNFISKLLLIPRAKIHILNAPKLLTTIFEFVTVWKRFDWQWYCFAFHKQGSLNMQRLMVWSMNESLACLECNCHIWTENVGYMIYWGSIRYWNLETKLLSEVMLMNASDQERIIVYIECSSYIEHLYMIKSWFFNGDCCFEINRPC